MRRTVIFDWFPAPAGQFIVTLDREACQTVPPFEPEDCAMPRPPVPEAFESLLASDQLAHLATVSADGQPEVTPVWFLWGAPHLLLGVKEDTIKYRNLLENPRLAISIAHPTDPFRYLQLQGQVIDFTLFTTLEFVNRLSRKYAGTDFPASEHGRRRYRLTVEITRWTGRP
jgi:PPOX class probable F420-dependent enzyme